MTIIKITKKGNLFLLMCLLLFASCSRDSNSMNVSGDPEISFDIDGVHYEHKGQATTANGGIGVSGVKIWGVQNVTQTVYEFVGTKDQLNSVQMMIGTGSDTLKQQEYKQSYVGSPPTIVSLILRADNKIYGLMQNGDFIDVKIDSYKGGVVSGLFSGHLTRTVSLNPLVVESATLTNGKIQNVTINYQ